MSEEEISAFEEINSESLKILIWQTWKDLKKLEFAKAYINDKLVQNSELTDD